MCQNVSLIIPSCIRGLYIRLDLQLFSIWHHCNLGVVMSCHERLEWRGSKFRRISNSELFFSLMDIRSSGTIFNNRIKNYVRTSLLLLVGVSGFWMMYFWIWTIWRTNVVFIWNSWLSIFLRTIIQSLLALLWAMTWLINSPVCL